MKLIDVRITACDHEGNEHTFRADVNLTPGLARDVETLNELLEGEHTDFHFRVDGPEPETFNTGDEVHWFETRTENEIYGGGVATETRQYKGRVLLVDREQGLAAITHRFPSGEEQAVIFLNVSRLKKGWQ